MLVHSESEMLALGRRLAAELKTPCVIELLGDVGVGKTTLVRGLAQGLGIDEAVTSPSFTIAKIYQGEHARLVHYDFYRLADPGLMSEDLAESIDDEQAVTVVEWGESVRGILPPHRRSITIKYVDENTREVTGI